jgi:hypothetical protein
MKWRVLEWVLFVIWVVAGLATMYPEFAKALHVHRTLFTSYAADLTNPAWLYLVLRRRSHFRWQAFVTRTPERAALLIFLGATATEISQYLWPRGPFAGRFDPLDIAAYALGVGCCYLAETRGLLR